MTGDGIDGLTKVFWCFLEDGQMLLRLENEGHWLS